MSEPSADFGTENRRDDEIPTIAPEKEPEYVGAHSALAAEECQQWIGETRDELEQCGNEATHTVVMWTGKKIAEVASCYRCGEPQDVEDWDREWSGEVVDR